MITIINYGMGNLGSVLNMFKYIGVAARISGDPKVIETSEKLLLPGVGAFDPAMKKLNESGLRDILDKRVLQHNVPVLGICLGMQLLTRRSEEGEMEGLGWIDGQTHKFKFEKPSGLKIPHMGWNNIHLEGENVLFRKNEELHRFYFVHSYYVKANNRGDVLATTHHGIDFDSVVRYKNIYGAQFHPEKSHSFGMRFLENFAKI